MTLEHNKALARLYFETFLEGDLAVFDQILDKAFYVYHIRDRGKPVPAAQKGPEPFKKAVLPFRAAFSEAQVTLDEVTAEQDRVIVCWTFSGKHTGILLGVQPTGKLIRYQGINGFQIKDNKLLESWDMQDSLHLFQQLALLPQTAKILGQ